MTDSSDTQATQQQRASIGLYTSRLRVERTSTNRAFIDPQLDGITAPCFAAEVTDDAWEPYLYRGDVLNVVMDERSIKGECLVVERDGQLFAMHFGYGVEPEDQVIGSATSFTRWLCSGEADDGVPAVFINDARRSRAGGAS